MQIREKNMTREENKNVERTWQETEHTTVQRAQALASLENECRKKLIEANYRYNQALVSIFELHNILNSQNIIIPIHKTIICSNLGVRTKNE